jgi:hypothetical protein
MREAIDQLLEDNGGVASRQLLLTVVTRAQLDDEIRRGRLVSIFAHAYARPWLADDLDVRDQAALVSVGAPVAISHMSALRRWGLAVAATDDVHVTTVEGHRVRGVPGRLIVHRTRLPLSSLTNRGVRTVVPSAAAIGAWAASAERRAHVIGVVRGRQASPGELRACAQRATRLPRRKELLSLLDLLEAGCESELEISGLSRVFQAPGLGHGRQQFAVLAGGRTYRLDRAYEAERVAVELDGDRFHSTREQRERDRQRDVALATIGWLTVRFSHQRLTADPARCQRDLLAILGRRGRRARSR